MEGADLELFEQSLRHAVEAEDGAAVDAALDELGWRDALDADPHAAVSLLFELQGATNAASSALDLVVLDALGVDHDGAGVVFPALGLWTPPGELSDRGVRVAGIGTAALATHEHALVVARSGTDHVVVLLPSDQLALRPIDGIDPWLGSVEVTADSITVGADPLPVPQWTTAVARAQVALGHELVGASRTMLALAREHALERIQFGRPIAGFQAVRHRLADTLVAIETAEAMLGAAWLDESPGTAAMAKALAGRGARTAMRHCQQVLAGIGFTTEHDLHRSVRRVLVLDELFGASRTLTRELGDDLLARRRLPPLLPL